MRGLIIAAPASGSGKTTITLGLLRALKNQSLSIRSAKSGPDYIDPAFHAAATGQPCLNLDAWAMPEAQIKALAAGDTPLLIEGAMGLYDGAPPEGRGATADLARVLSLPVVLVVDAASMGHSVAALVKGFAEHDPKVRIAGVILNKVGSARHEDMLRSALLSLDIPVLGAIHRAAELARPSRHLGLVQAGEMPDLESFLNRAAKIVSQAIDINELTGLFDPLPKIEQLAVAPRKRTIAIARDAAFSFIYPHHIASWRAEGATLQFFSPLADEPVPEADLVFLPGGYPELYGRQLAANTTFMQSLRKASQVTAIYGECGGYMTLGETLADADGTVHKMAGLLPLETSFAARKLHLGYRTLTPAEGGAAVQAHEFHYATTLRAEGTPLWQAKDATGTDLGPVGLRAGRVSGSFAHLISAF